MSVRCNRNYTITP